MIGGRLWKIGDRVFRSLPAGTNHGHFERYSRLILRWWEIFHGGKGSRAPAQMAAEGAQIIDVGGESTRPGAEYIGPKEELNRVIPVIEVLYAKSDTTISIDTSKAQVARVAIQAGASIVNDITGGRGDDKMMPLVAENKSAFIVMHMQGAPQTMQLQPRYDDVVSEWLIYSTTVCARNRVRY